MALGLDVEVEVKRRGSLYEVAYWWFFDSGRAPPALRYYKRRGDRLAKIFCERFVGKCAGPKDDVRAYIRWPLALVPIFWFTAAMAVDDEQRLRGYLEYLISETKPLALLDLVFEAMTWNFECDQLMLLPRETAKAVKEVIELGMMVQREYDRLLREGRRPPDFDADAPIEISVRRDGTVRVGGFGVGIPLFTYKAADGRRLAETLCSRFNCAKADGGVKAVVEGYPVVYALTWSLAAMVLKPYEYEDYVNAIVLYGVSNSTLRTIGFALKGTDELLLFKRKTAEVVKRLVDSTIALEKVKAAGCKRLHAPILNYT